MPTFTGTAGDDILNGTAGNDIFDGLGGNDTIMGGGGNDQMTGGHGDDILLGEDGDDLIFENDSGSGNDVLDGGAGNDILSIYRLDWSLNEAVTIRGGDGNDNITSWSYASGSVTIDGGAGDDVLALFTSNTSHNITLGTGRDIIDLGPYQPLQGIGLTSRIVTDFQTGAAGDTVLLYNLLSGYGHWDGQSNPFETGVIRLLQRGSDAVLQMSGAGGSPNFIDLLVFQNLTTQSFLAENLGGFSPNGVPAAPVNSTGDIWANRLTGGYGDDIIDGLGGNDILDGLAGNDVLRGGDGDDIIRGGYGNDVVEGGAGHDYIDMQHDGGSDYVDAGAGNDVIRIYRNGRGVVEHVTVTAGDGNDELSFQNFDQGTLTVSFGSGMDRFTLLGTRNDVTLTLGANADVVDFSQNYTMNTLIGEMLVTITDFVPGEDRLEWGTYLQNELAGWNGTSNPFVTGHLQLQQQSGQVVLYIDRDGAGTDFTASPFLVLKNVLLSSLSPTDFAGFNPAGTRDVRNDFNGDGRSDVLWRHDNGQLSNWLGQANGGFVGNDANAMMGVSTNWQVAGTGDFNGDGRDDILWRSNIGQVSNWLATASGGWQNNDVNALIGAPTNWKVAGVGDFNGDNRDDILWRSDAGQVSDWLGTPGGGWQKNDANAFTSAPSSWKVAGVGDFNGDGRDDILWRNDNGQLSDWLGQANGGFVGNDGNALVSVSTSWKVIGVGDFNGDGRDDILWRSNTGTLSNWLGQANGGFVANDGNALTNVPLSWHIAQIGDFNGDGRDDILWRSDTGGFSNWLGQANGGFAGNDANAFNSVPTAWHVQDPDIFWL